jgi:hypothetical protein
MNAMPKLRPDNSEPSAPETPPPHLLWATLESAYAPTEQSPPASQEPRLVPYLALPIAIGLSLVLWVVIVELVLMR